ncbi:TIGR01906 family membrane protein [Parvimonas sp. D2]|uniref:TIGR01906 family membrane protein n=1 Tax=unclassified Parvimonas TaxID=1151464 RepID=UPI002B479ED6|nr:MULTISPECIES: TIGR01906 family membrane protein [unclassified Parvimonas]MEB3012142.1 TIGR01906 family membrane protein [Parvimonas sp. D2]MEB3087425.1 TIGR01906 family membrane protein [Parvimonas sp. D4]
MKKIFAFLISLSIILFILLYSIDFMAKDISYYNNFHNEYKIEEESGLSKEWIESASNSLVEFIKNGDKEVLKNHFNEKEISHMEDVYKLFKLDRVVYTSLFIITLIVFIYKLIKNDKLFFKYIRKYILISYIAVISFLGVCSMFFSESFIYFHKLFFNNDLWLLDYKTDLMIRILPEEFFFVLFLNVLVLSTICILLIYIFLKFKDNKYS